MIDKTHSPLGMKTLLVAGFVGVLLGGNAIASNMGFKMNFTFTVNTPPNNLHWISIPDFYSPPDVPTSFCAPPCNDAADLSADIGGTAKYNFINRRHPTFGTFETWPTNGYPSTAFPLDKRTGYEVEVAATYTGNSIIVGSHDDSYNPPFTLGVPANNLHWISIPYHFSRNGNVLVAGQDAMDISVDLGGPPQVSFINRRHPTFGTFETWPTNGYPSTAFPITTGEAFEIEIVANTTWTVSHY